MTLLTSFPKPVDLELKHTADGSEIRLTSWYGKYPVICRVSYMFGGAGFLPSTVSIQWDVPLQMFMVSHPIRGSLTRIKIFDHICNRPPLQSSATISGFRCLKSLQRTFSRGKKLENDTHALSYQTGSFSTHQKVWPSKGRRKRGGYKVSKQNRLQYIYIYTYDSKHHSIY